MPRIKPRPSKHANGSKSPPVAGEIVVEVRPDTPTYYVNHAEVTNTPHDFAITFAQLPVKLSPDAVVTAKETNKIFVEPVVITVLPATLVPGLIKALTVRREMHEKMFGPIRDVADQQEEKK